MDREVRVITKSIAIVFISSTIKSFTSEKRFPKNLTISDFKGILELITGYSSGSKKQLEHLVSWLEEFSYYASLMEAAQMNNVSTLPTLKQLFLWFTRFGFPRTLHSDNGPQFTNDKFRIKLSEWGVKLTLSQPYHPQSNGLTDRAVRIIKSLMKKNPGLSLDELLFSYRSTPLVCGKTPSELLLSRKIRTRLDAMLPQESPCVKDVNKTQMDKNVWCRNLNNRKPTCRNKESLISSRWESEVLRRSLIDHKSLNQYSRGSPLGIPHPPSRVTSVPGAFLGQPFRRRGR
ncbi:unnamed protein product [Lepeophtheirus salmonis]|uniref:(salmon louse) hypothetical protein n=1 Tax=Lepeophtheirus salmonis TaxID=72036 RepID=A0A7R8CWH2_LEPSM|nr:unnamed protein product [Lepeophtheirus salmonis]CAF2922139.1 unnamed protein product [Lepeophtheirus salmonis]